MKCYAKMFFILLFSSNSWAGQDPLLSFCKGLDKTLRQLHQPSAPKSCQETQYYPSATASLFEGNPTTLLSEQDAQNLFKEMSDHKELAFGFPYAGCEVRSGEMAYLMHKKGITALRGVIWIDSENPEAPRLQFKDKKTKKTYFWVQHEAPVVLVNKKGRSIPYVIDPGTQDKAVPYSAWKKTFTTHVKKMKYEGQITFVPQDFSNEVANQIRAEDMKRIKSYEGKPDGIALYQAQEMQDQEDFEGKIQAAEGQ